MYVPTSISKFVILVIYRINDVCGGLAADKYHSFQVVGFSSFLRTYRSSSFLRTYRSSITGMRRFNRINNCLGTRRKSLWAHKWINKLSYRNLKTSKACVYFVRTFKLTPITHSVNCFCRFHLICNIHSCLCSSKMDQMMSKISQNLWVSRLDTKEPYGKISAKKEIERLSK